MVHSHIHIDVRNSLDRRFATLGSALRVAGYESFAEQICPRQPGSDAANAATTAGAAALAAFRSG
jgi:hypothetical protein